MSAQRDFHITVFGATGVTGKYVAEELHRLKQEKGHEHLRWAMAGRTLEKLKQTANELGIEDAEYITADVDIQKSLNQMCMKSGIVIDCVGPFQLYGEPVVKACIDQKCHYIDVSGETYFIELMEEKYQEQAKEAGVFVISACAFCSIPHDMGVRFTEENFTGKLEYVESYIEFFKFVGFNTGSFETMLFDIANHAKLTKLRCSQNKPKLPAGRKAPSRGSLYYNDTLKKWCTPFSSPDGPVVDRTQRYLHETTGKQPINLKIYLTFKSRLHIIVLSIGFIFLYLLSGYKWGRNILMRFCGIFSGGLVSKGGPPKEKLQQTTFAITMFGCGKSDTTNNTETPDVKIVTRVRGVDPGYSGTSAMLVQSALCIVDHRDLMPKSGGVYTPAIAFGDTPLIENLKKTGKVIFEVLEPSSKD